MNQRVRCVIACLFLFCSTTFGQFNKGGTSRAVIIGISDYQNEDIPDLQFAHRDAEAFYDYLNSPAGGKIKKGNIRLLTNKKATGGNVHKALNWLIRETQSGDRCILYLSGHGDVEAESDEEQGHFLVYDSPARTYQVNSLRLNDLDDIIKRLTVEKNAQVIVYTDACRSGKLAGSGNKGTQATAAAMSRQFANEIKLLSCQPNQYSVEGKQWGGGRGLFSYKLLEGLNGLADKNQDYSISLKEVERYIDDEIEMIGPKRIEQNPVALGDKNQRLAHIDPKILEEALSQSETDVQIVDRKALQAERFYTYLESGSFLPMNAGDTSHAAFVFDRIQEEDPNAEKTLLMRGDFISALQDEAQKSINEYLATDPLLMEQRFSGDTTSFFRYARYLEKAAQLMGEFHYLYAQMKAKAIYFDVVTQRLQLEKAQIKKEAYNNLILKLEEALTYQPRAPFINNELGLVYLKLHKYEKALEQFNLAISASPTWVLPLINKSFTLTEVHQHEEALVFANKAVKLDSTYPNSLMAKSYSLGLLERPDEAILLDQLIIEQFPKEIWGHINYAHHHYLINKDIDSAILLYERVLDLDKNNTIALYSIGGFLNTQKKYKKALKYLLRARSYGSDDKGLYQNLGTAYYFLKDYQNSVASYEEAIDIDPKSPIRVYLCFALMKLQRHDEVINHLGFYINNVNSSDPWIYFDLACAHAMKSDKVNFEQNMIKALNFGFNSKKEMEESEYLSSIRDSEEYRRIFDRL